MLDANVIKTVQATIPAVAGLGPNLTKAFYERMLGNYPELKNIFNMSHQASGAQREALFNAVAAYAMNIENPSVLLGPVTKIAHKHCSLGVEPEQYAIVGKCLLETIEELLNPGKEVIDAWASAYGMLKDIMVDLEASLYKANAEAEGGWSKTREFKVTKKTPLTPEMTAFELTPVDGKAVVSYQPGQYIGIYIKDAGWEFQQIRQYSLTHSPNGSKYYIAVKRDPKGVVSNYLLDKVNEGDVVNLSCPYGDFFYDSAATQGKELTFICAGSGITPLRAMLEKVATSEPNRKVHFVYSTQDDQRLPFIEDVKALGSKLNSFALDVFLTKQDSTSSALDAQHQGRIELKKLNLNKDGEFYLCGPVGFMQEAAKQLVDLGVNKDQIHYEVFGPHKVI